MRKPIALWWEILQASKPRKVKLLFVPLSSFSQSCSNSAYCPLPQLVPFVYHNTIVSPYLSSYSFFTVSSSLLHMVFQIWAPSPVCLGWQDCLISIARLGEAPTHGSGISWPFKCLSRRNNLPCLPFDFFQCFLTCDWVAHKVPFAKRREMNWREGKRGGAGGLERTLRS